MTNEQAYVVLENCASLLDSGTRFFTEDHTKQFREAYELAMKALRKTERKTGKWSIKEGELAFWNVCSECGRMVIHKAPFYNYCPNCGAKMVKEGMIVDAVAWRPAPEPYCKTESHEREVE